MMKDGVSHHVVHCRDIFGSHCALARRLWVVFSVAYDLTQLFVYFGINLV